MSSSKNRGKGGAKKPRPKKTTAKKTAPGPTPRDQETASSVPAQATDGDVTARGAMPEGGLSAGGQPTVDDGLSATTEPQRDETSTDDAVSEDSVPGDSATGDSVSEAAVVKDEAPRGPDEPGNDDEASEAVDTALEPAQGPTVVEPSAAEPSAAEPSEQTPVDHTRPIVPSGATTAVPSPADDPADATARGKRDGRTDAREVVAAKDHDEGAGEAERTEDIEDTDGSEDGAEAPDATAPNEGGRRKTLGKVFAGLLAVGLGFAVMTQVRQTEKSGLDKLSQADLVALLADVNAQSSRLNTELDELRATKQKLDSGGDSAAVADAQKRLDQLSVLNGTTKVKGPGILISVVNTHHEVTAANVLDAVEELRDAGAESIEVDGTRVVASTWFSDEGGRPTVEGRALNDTFTIRAIGDPHTMSTAMAIPGGVTDTLTQAGAQVKVTEDTSMQINSVVASTR